MIATIGKEEAAKLLNVTVRTITFWTERAKQNDRRYADFPYHQIGARCRLRFEPERLLRWWNLRENTGSKQQQENRK